jgi:erythromycin esterase
MEEMKRVLLHWSGKTAAYLLSGILLALMTACSTIGNFALTVEPQTVTPSEQVTITGSGMLPHTPVQVIVAPYDMEAECQIDRAGTEMIDVTSDAKGHFTLVHAPQPLAESNRGVTYVARLTATPMIASNRVCVGYADDVVQWIQASAHPLHSLDANAPVDDLEMLDAIVGGATIVGLGEATHGSSEFFTVKHRLIRYLVEKMGFTTLVLETDWPVGLALNEYIHSGTGDPLATGLPWIWRTQEVLGLIEWMRAYNANPAHTNKLYFAGMDIQQITPEMFDNVHRFIQTHDPDSLPVIEQYYAELRTAPGGYELYSTLEQGEKTRYAAQAQQVVDFLQAHQAELLKSASPVEFAWALQNAHLIQRFTRMMELFGSDPGQGYTYHETAMAENVAFWHASNGKSLLWAHNAHVSHYTMGFPYPGKVMGTFLHERFGNNYMNIGFSFGKGQFNALTRTATGVSQTTEVYSFGVPAVDSTEATLGLIGMKNFLLDLRQAPEVVQAWLNAPRLLRIGAASVSADPQERDSQSYASGTLREWFDVLVHLDHITPSYLIPID